MRELFEGKTILVTGGTGSIGRAIVRKILDYQPKAVRVFARGESDHFDMQHEFAAYPNLRFLVGDVRDRERLKVAMRGVDIVFHAAALKHVPSCEYNPFEAVKTNVLGTQYLIDFVLSGSAKKLISISTDKATNPTNVMGATKLLSERLIAAGHHYRGDEKKILSSVRFGNVLGSAGSVVPLFLKQMREGREITLTDPEMTRFVMSIPQAIDLVFKATQYAEGGEIFILKMPAVKMGVLTEALIELYCEEYSMDPGDFKVRHVGPRPGEKLYEELMSLEESENAFESSDMFFLSSRIERIKRKLDLKPSAIRRYTSHEVELLEKSQIKELLLEYSAFQRESINV